MSAMEAFELVEQELSDRGEKRRLEARIYSNLHRKFHLIYQHRRSFQNLEQAPQRWRTFFEELGTLMTWEGKPWFTDLFFEKIEQGYMMLKFEGDPGVKGLPRTLTDENSVTFRSSKELSRALEESER